MTQENPLPATTNTGAELDGVTGPETLPFLSAPDAAGMRHSFGIAWPFSQDMQGGVLARAAGYRSGLLGSTISNTGIYDLMYKVLFGQD
jgi:glycerophosphoryl diester phosphodiesterase